MARLARKITAAAVGLLEASRAAVAVHLLLFLGAVVILNGLSDTDVSIDAEVSVLAALGA